MLEIIIHWIALIAEGKYREIQLNSRFISRNYPAWRRKRKMIENTNRDLGICSKISEGLLYMQLEFPKQKSAAGNYLNKKGHQISHIWNDINWQI